MHRPGDTGEVGDRAIGEQGEQAASRALEHQQPPAGRGRVVVRQGRLQPQRLGRVRVRVAVRRDGHPLDRVRGGGVGVRYIGRDPRHLTRQVQREGAAAAEFAFRDDLPAEQRADLARDRQPEAGAAVPAAEGAVTLLEGAEDRADVLGRDADSAVGHREGQDLASVGRS